MSQWIWILLWSLFVFLTGKHVGESKVYFLWSFEKEAQRELLEELVGHMEEVE